MNAHALRIGVVAPPWLPVPPPGYGGTELMVDALCNGLKRLGHEVVLFTLGASTAPVERHWLFDRMDPDRMGAAVEELRHALAAYDDLLDVDIIHDHTLVGMFVGPTRSPVPIVTTMHGPFDEAMSDLYGRTSHRVPIVAISHDQARRAPPHIEVATVIHHGLELSQYPFSDAPDEHVLFLGRMSPNKGVESAIDIARGAGRRLLIAARIREPGERRYFHDVIEPLLGADVSYVGEATFDEKVRLLSSAAALVNPIRWPEPFGLVMAEALACGTPVVGGSIGAAPEIVDDGTTGFLSNDVPTLVDGLSKIDRISRATCRQAVVDRFSSDRMAADYVRFYRRVIGSGSFGVASAPDQRRGGTGIRSWSSATTTSSNSARASRPNSAASA